ncbi:B12-binding domain-containing radical SAM protein [Fibrobacterota bacterium]
MVDLVLSRPGLTSKAEKYWSYNLPLGLGYLASYAQKHNISIKIIDGKLSGHLSIEKTIQAILSCHPRYVGISTITVDFPMAEEIAEKLKQRSKDLVIILGGPHINALPVQSLKESPHVDYVITGQAEKSLAELVLCLKDKTCISGINGLYYKDSQGEIFGNEALPPNEDLSVLPFPAWSLFPKRSFYPIMTERGCPYYCVFCSNNMSHTIRSRPVEHVMEEIKWLNKEFGARHISFEDETFGLNPERTEDLLKKIIPFNKDLEITFGAQTRVNCITESLVALMKKTGFNYISLGIESGDPTVLSRSGKGISLEQVDAAVNLVRKAGLKTWLKFIIGLPGETAQSVKNTIQLASRLNPERFSAATIVAYPGSTIYKWAREKKNGYRLLSDRWDKYDKYLSSSVELETLSILQMKRLQIQMILQVYLFNFRFRELFQIIKRNFAAIPIMLLNLVMSLFTSKTRRG